MVFDLAKSVKWPSGVGAKGNSGVAGVIQNTPGAIGYVNLSYIKGNGRNTMEIQDSFSKLISDEYQDKASPLGFFPLKEDILEKSIFSFKKIGR